MPNPSTEALTETYDVTLGAESTAAMRKVQSTGPVTEEGSIRTTPSCGDKGHLSGRSDPADRRRPLSVTVTIVPLSS